MVQLGKGDPFFPEVGPIPKATWSKSKISNILNNTKISNYGNWNYVKSRLF